MVHFAGLQFVAFAFFHPIARQVTEPPEHEKDEKDQSQFNVGSPIVFEYQLFVGNLLFFYFFA